MDITKYFMQQTDKKLDELKYEIKSLEAKMDELITFKIQMLTSAKGTSMLWSGVIGATTIIINIVTVYFMVKR